MVNPSLFTSSKTLSIRVLDLDTGDKSTIAAETTFFVLTKSRPKIGILKKGSGKNTQCKIFKLFENSAIST